MVQVRADVVAQARAAATDAVEAARTRLDKARAEHRRASAACAAAVLQARHSRVPWARLRDLTGASRQALRERITRSLGDTTPRLSARMPAEIASGRVTGAWQQLATTASDVDDASTRLAAAIVTARETGVPWRQVTTAAGMAQQPAIRLVRRIEAGGRGDTTPIWRGTRPAPAGHTGEGPWRWPTVRTAVTRAATAAGDELRRRMLLDGADPTRITTAVTAVRTHAQQAAIHAVETGDPNDPQQLADAAWQAATTCTSEPRP